MQGTITKTNNTTMTTMTAIMPAGKLDVPLAFHAAPGPVLDGGGGREADEEEEKEKEEAVDDWLARLPYTRRGRKDRL